MNNDFETLLDNMYPDLPLVDNIQDMTGYDDINELLHDIICDVVEPVGVCTSCGEVVGFGVEPDAENYFCEFCLQNTVTSLQVIVGLI